MNTITWSKISPWKDLGHVYIELSVKRYNSLSEVSICSDSDTAHFPWPSIFTRWASIICLRPEGKPCQPLWHEIIEHFVGWWLLQGRPHLADCLALERWQTPPSLEIGIRKWGRVQCLLVCWGGKNTLGYSSSVRYHQLFNAFQTLFYNELFWCIQFLWGCLFTSSCTA